MCGIAGFLDFSCRSGYSELQTIIQRMSDAIFYRGPDDSGMWIDSEAGIALGHRRLSIIDLSSNANQPMSNEDGSLWITYNGEIYNYCEVRGVLLLKGHRFKSNSDTEVILHAYEEWGEKCLDRFSGMFAFSIWDAKNKQLFLARDRIGKKPLFYYHDSKIFAFASELQAILALDIERNIDLSVIHQYLAYQYIAAPKSAFKNIFKLPPANFLILKKGDIKLQRYWDIDFSKKVKIKDERELSDELFERLKNSVKNRLISDVPFGAFLSGGVDSSIVVALMSELMKEPVKTFSIGFEENAYNELPYARQIAKLFKTDHKEFIVKFDALNIIPKLVRHYGEPFADSSALPTYYLSNMTSEFVKVALSGDGGDESFAGYDRYYAMKLMKWLRHVPKSIRSMVFKGLNGFGESDGKNNIKRLKRFLKGSLHPHNYEYFQWMVAFSKDDMAGLYDETMLAILKNDNPYLYLMNLFERSTANNIVERAMDADIHSYLPFDLLVKVDIASMANSLEVRCPFLEHSFMEFAAGIPIEYKIRGYIKKYILKKAFKGIMPDSIIKRKKTGFGVPVCRWFRNDLKGYISDILLSRRALERGYFKQEAIIRLLTEHLSERLDHSPKLWSLLILELWHREFID